MVRQQKKITKEKKTNMKKTKNNSPEQELNQCLNQFIRHLGAQFNTGYTAMIVKRSHRLQYLFRDCGTPNARAEAQPVLDAPADETLRKAL